MPERKIFRRPDVRLVKPCHFHLRTWVWDISKPTWTLDVAGPDGFFDKGKGHGWKIFDILGWGNCTTHPTSATKVRGGTVRVDLQLPSSTLLSQAHLICWFSGLSLIHGSGSLCVEWASIHSEAGPICRPRLGGGFLAVE